MASLLQKKVFLSNINIYDQEIDYNDLDSHVGDAFSKTSQRGLIIASKILQAMANRTKFETSRLSEENRETILKFMEENQSAIQKFVAYLTVSIKSYGRCDFYAILRTRKT